jgi:hypothetical protein
MEMFVLRIKDRNTVYFDDAKKNIRCSVAQIKKYQIIKNGA